MSKITRFPWFNGDALPGAGATGTLPLDCVDKVLSR
jgi:hypothetical protein